MEKKDLHLKLGKALYKVALKNNLEERIFAELEALLPLLKEENFLNYCKQLSFVDKKHLQKIISTTFGDQLREPVQNLLIILIVQRAVTSFPLLYQTYKKEYFKNQNILDIMVCSGYLLDENQQKDITKKLQAAKGNNKIHIKFTYNPELIAGIQIYEDGKLTDFTAKHYLQTLKNQLLKQDSLL